MRANGIVALGNYNDTEIDCRPEDGFVNATAMCQATGKRWAAYWQNQQTQEFISSLGRNLRCQNSDILEVIQGRGDRVEQGTWVHRRVAIHLAQWCSPDFAVWVSGQIEAIMTGRGVSHREHAEHAIADIRNDIGVLHSKYESLVSQMLVIQQDNQKILAQLLPMVQRIDERTQGKREGFSNDTEKLFVLCIERFYKGDCPCCQSTKIVESGKRVPYVSHLEHYHHRSMNRPEHGWLTCKTCNSKLANRKPDGFWFKSGPAFLQFQRLLHSSDQLYLPCFQS